MFEAATWWLVVEILGLAALPLAAFVFRRLPDRGYAFAKPLGLLLPSYALWLLSSVGALDNARGTIALLVVVIGVVIWAALAEGRRELASLWGQRRGVIILVEVLFAVAFAVWTVVRAYNPDIVATEKPMEFAFLNGVLRSQRFPPVDPWLSGFSISYYYFGYVMVALLVRLSGVSAGVAFNLAVAMLFSLTLIGAFSLAYNLAASRESKDGNAKDPPPDVAAGFSLRVGSVKSPHPSPLPEGEGSGVGALPDGKGNNRAAQSTNVRHGLIGPIRCGLLGSLFVVLMGNLEGFLEMLHSRAALPLSFWQWLNIQNLDKPYVGTSWYPSDWFWWFRASRVIGDFDPITKVSRDYTINEFPSFSFILGDLHPHVLALPFAVLALTLALSMLLAREDLTPRNLRKRPLEVAIWGLIFGGLGFLNSWDLPTYLGVFVVAYALQRRLAGGRWIRDAAFLGIALLALSVILYVPFYLGFSSQVKGIGVVLVRTKLHQFLIFWGPFVFLAAAFLLAKLGSLQSGMQSRHGIGLSGADSNVLTIVIVAAATVLLVVLQAAVLALLLPIILVAHRLLFGPRARTQRREDVFVVLLFILGALLLFVCELLFVRDFFGNRMNTIFKVYYQVWQMFAVGSAYVIYYSLRGDFGAAMGKIPRLLSRSAFGIAVLLALASFIYPVTATLAKTAEFAGSPRLDGMAFMSAGQRNDYEAVTWLNKNVRGTPIVLEAPGGSYSEFGRVSETTGLPTVIGWDGHELQWRGSGEEATRRKADVETIFQTTDEQLACQLLAKYNVSYVYVGSLETQAYGKAGPLALGKFANFADVVYRNPGVTIYRIRSDKE